MRIFEVGGCVRDELLGIATKDWDYSVWVDDWSREAFLPQRRVALAFDKMRSYMQDAGFEIFVESPEYGTIRARFPRGDRDKTLAARTADFVLCRKDGPSSDGRRPDYVEVGTLTDDLKRRDFTINALAREIDTETFQALPISRFGRTQDYRGDDPTIIDLFGGLMDLEARRIRFVGDPMDRLREDGLRALRAIRFKITKGFEFHQTVRDVLKEAEVAELLAGTSVERRREELEKCFHHDTLGTLDVLESEISRELLEATFSGNLRLAATQKRDRVRLSGEK